MNEDLILFFTGHEEALPLFYMLEKRIQEISHEPIIKIQKTQVSFSNKYGFAYVSFLPARKAKDRPASYMTISFGLPYRLDSPRIDAASEPYPNRWTHHVMISQADEIDEELVEWIREAATFSESKR